MENENTNDAFTFYISGNILVFIKFEKNKPKQPDNVPCFGFGTICIILGKVLVLMKLFLCFIIIKMVPNCKTPHVFLRFQETLKLDHLEVIFPKIVLVIILWNVMSQNRFSC